MTGSRTRHRRLSSELLRRMLEQFEKTASDVTLGELVEAYVTDAEARGLRTVPSARRAGGRAIAFFGRDAVEIGSRRLYDFQQDLQRTMKPGTVNVNMAYLRAALKHGARNGLLSRCPDFPRKLPEGNVRKGFIEHGDYLAILGELDPWARDPFSFAYYSGWRRNEVLGLLWEEVDFDEGMVRLSPERSKNRSSRDLPFVGEIPEILERAALARARLPLVFHRDGRPISAPSMNRAFKISRELAGRPNVLIHDCRRTAVRNLVRSGVSDLVAMGFTGHKTRAIYDRYNITDPRDRREGAKLYTDFMMRKGEAEAERRGDVVPFKKKA